MSSNSYNIHAGFKRTITFHTLSFFILLWGGMSTAHSSLIGDEIFASGTQLGPASAIVGTGQEFSGISGHLGFDFDESTLTVTAIQPLTVFSVFGTYLFSDLNWVNNPLGQITNVSVQSNSGFSGGLIDNFTFGSDFILFDLNPTTLVNGIGSEVVFKIEASHDVPEPHTIFLLSLGLLGVALTKGIKGDGGIIKRAVSLKNKLVNK